jgi:hypothetical protein
VTDTAIAPSPANLLSVPPVEMLRQAYAIAIPLAKMIEGSKLSVNIGGRKFVKVEGWTAAGSMLGVFPVVVSTARISFDGPPQYTAEGEIIPQIITGWEAAVEARTLAGAKVGRAESQCDRSEKTWHGRDEFALRAMAQTRATSRAMRGPLGFIMALAGYEATAYEEMPPDGK